MMIFINLEYHSCWMPCNACSVIQSVFCPTLLDPAFLLPSPSGVEVLLPWLNPLAGIRTAICSSLRCCIRPFDTSSSELPSSRSSSFSRFPRHCSPLCSRLLLLTVQFLFLYSISWNPTLNSFPELHVLCLFFETSWLVRSLSIVTCQRDPKSILLRS